MRYVRKGWLFGNSLRPIHIIVDGRGFVFGAGMGGWRLPRPHERLKVLPRRIPVALWPHDGWWLKNWRLPEWAWIYGQQEAE